MASRGFPKVRDLLARLVRERRSAVTGSPVVAPAPQPGAMRPERLTPAAEAILRDIMAAYREAGEPLPENFERHVRRRAPHLLDEIF